MTEDEDDDDVYREITFAEAKKERKERIKWLRDAEGEDDRRILKLLKSCGTGNRCNLDKCPVCALRARRAARRLGSVAQAIYPLDDRPFFRVSRITVEAVKTIGKRRSLDEEKVGAIAASMSQIGLRTPITVREEKKKSILVCGLYRLEAAKRLKWETIPCFIFPGNERESRPLQISEDIYRAELTAMERAEYINELRALIRNKVGQAALPGGKQPKDIGINKAAKALGFTKEEIRRAKAIAWISAKAKEAAKNLGLDDNQDALLEIAKLPTPEAQCKAVATIDERKRAARARRATAAVADNEKAAAEIEEIEASIEDKLQKVDSLKDKVASQRERVRKIEDELIGKSVDATLAPVDPSPSIVPADDPEIPPASDEDDGEVPDPDLDQALADLQAAWDAAAELREAWEQAPLTARKRFIAEVLWSYAS
jgi:ParB-like chromosome segregation protein Spo0J